MKIIATPFDRETLKVTAPGASTGFTSVDQTVAALGADFLSRGARLVVYGDNTSAVIYSDIDYGSDNR